MISESVKKIIEGYMNNSELADMEIAEIVSMSPVKIKVADIAEPLDGSFIIVPERLIKDTYYIFLDDSEIQTKITLVDHILKVGDKVVLMKAKGGQKYFVLDKVVEYDTTRRINNSI